MPTGITAYLDGSNYEVIVFGKGAELREQDNANGVARFGGMWRQPSYQRAYLRAARLLLDKASETDDLDQLGLPIFYLLRHATELMLKSQLSMLYEVADMRSKSITTATRRQSIPSANARDRLRTSHNLARLLRDLTTAASTLGYSEFLPKSLPGLIQDLAQYELNPTWSRYATSGDDGRTLHTDKEVAIPVVDLHRQLESVFLSISADPARDTSTFGGEVYWEWNHLMQQSQADDSL